MNLCRTCIVCKQKNKKNNLIRVVSDNLTPIYDRSQKINSRGIYICNNSECLKKAIVLLNKNKLNIKINLNKDKFHKLLENIKEELEELI